MGKRSSGAFPRRRHDAYFTPLKPVWALIPHLPHRPFTYIEPCAGDGRLVQHLNQISEGVCEGAFDIVPQAEWVLMEDALEIVDTNVDMFITNPPWTRNLLHPLIEHLSTIAPCWLLFDTDWAHTKQALPYLRYCKKIVAVGRVSWMENGKAGKDNSAWYLFDQGNNAQTEFYGLTA